MTMRAWRRCWLNVNKMNPSALHVLTEAHAKTEECKKVTLERGRPQGGRGRGGRAMGGRGRGRPPVSSPAPQSTMNYNPPASPARSYGSLVPPSERAMSPAVQLAAATGLLAAASQLGVRPREDDMEDDQDP